MSRAGLSVNLSVPQATHAAAESADAGDEERDGDAARRGCRCSPSAADGLQACSAGADRAGIGARRARARMRRWSGRCKIMTPLLATSAGRPGVPRGAALRPVHERGRGGREHVPAVPGIAGSGSRDQAARHGLREPGDGAVDGDVQGQPAVAVQQLQLHFKSGLRAPLATPQCVRDVHDHERSHAVEHPDHPGCDAELAVQRGLGRQRRRRARRCRRSIPSFSAGTSNPNAGQFSPLTVTFDREDREQDLSAIQVHMPPGSAGDR